MHSGESPHSALPTNWSPTFSLKRQHSFTGPLFYPALRQMDFFGGYTIYPHVARVAAPFILLWEPNKATSTPRLLILSFRWFRALWKLFINLEYWFPPGKRFWSPVKIEGLGKRCFARAKIGQMPGWPELAYICQGRSQFIPSWSPF